MSAKDLEDTLLNEVDSDCEEVQDIVKLKVSSYFFVPELKGLVKKRPRESVASLRISYAVIFINFL